MLPIDRFKVQGFKGYESQAALLDHPNLEIVNLELSNS
jgi:hypothetical protein